MLLGDRYFVTDVYIRAEDINDYEMKYTGHSPNLMLLENSN